MWIEKSKDKYRACDRYTDPLTGAVHKVGVTIDRDTPQARNKARKELDNIIANKTCLAKDGVTLEALIKLYLADIKNTLKASTVTRNTFACDRFKAMFGNCDVSKLSAGIVKQRIIGYKDGNPTTVNNHIKLFKAFIRWAYRNDYIADISWLDKLTPLKEKTRREKVADKFLEPREYNAILDGMTIDLWRDLTKFLLLSGLRIGEALALNESDLDFSAREISVTKTLDVVNGVVGTTKTLTSTRQVYMQDDLLAFCRALVASNRLKRKTLYLDRTPLFFDLRGDYVSYDAYRQYLGDVSYKVIGRRVTPHIMRHTHASILAETMPYDAISRRLGHADSRITREIYIHVTEKRKERENEMIKEVHIV